MDDPDRSVGGSDPRLDLPPRPASVPIRPLGLAFILAAAVTILSMAGSAIALAATTIVLDPNTATPGTKVTVLNACYLVTDHPPAKLKTAFVDTSSTGLQPGDASVPKTVAHVVIAPNTYAFTVPDIPAGDYNVALECLPGDWSTNGAEGASLPLTVIAGPPATSTVSALPAQGESWPTEAVVLVFGIGLLGGLASWRRARPRA